MKTARQIQIVSAFAVWCLAACEQQAPAGGQVSIGEKRSLYSAILEEEREYLVYLPARYDEDEYSPRAYPVLYILDGGTHFHAASGTVEFMSAGNNGNLQIPELIVVAIPNTNRTRDLTPTHTKTGYDGEETEFLSASGGGNDFLRFIREELFAEIESRYRTVPHRTLVGHSFGGLLALHTLVNAPDMFQAYIAIDPSLWWDQQKLVAQAGAVFATEATRRADVYLSMADHPGVEPGEPDVMQDTTRRFADILKHSASAGIRSTVQLFEAEDHGSVPHLSLYHGLLHVFDNYKFALDDIMEEREALAAHFNRISDRMGVEFLTPEWMVDEIAYYVMEGLEESDKALDLFRVNADNYPGSANVYVSLGEAYRARGETRLAIENLEKALEIDPDHYHVEWTHETLMELREAD